jgi:DNA uptake protein ComE-like DNA-binding protein
MSRLTNFLSLAAAIALAACTAKPDNAADTTAMAADTSMTASTSTSTMPTTGATAGTTTGATTGGTTTGGTAAGGATAGGTTTSSTAAITPININTATDAQILAIPGMGPRMLREFKEYRPYTSIEQFRREIGKYVDKAEVARLEQYITIK